MEVVMHGFRFPLLIVTALATLLLAGGLQRPVSADEDERRLPDDCSSGEIVVYAYGEFECVSVSEALHLSDCSAGDFLTVEYGTFKCVGREDSASSAHALLPRCSSGEILVSEGFGEWGCASRQ
jgi:hypothetical protein